MKSAALFCLLAIAGASALPRSEVEERFPDKDRLIEIFFRNTIEQASRWVQNNNLDPVNIDRREFDYNIIDGLVGSSGFVESLQFDGLSNIQLNNVRYHLISNRLDFDISVPQINLSIGKYVARAVYDDFVGGIEASGKLTISDINVRGYIVMRLDEGVIVDLANINSIFTIGNIEADVKVDIGRDVSRCVNNFINERIPAWLTANHYELNVLVGEIIRYVIGIVW